ncbi:MAG: hypothetical protein ISS63_03460 [Desulfobacteraceae bacterium]|nr:hypothetical protein [Desulfobacteraceae bacterium]
MRETYIAPTMHEALIEYTIPDKPRSSKQKYRLIDKGRKLIKDSRFRSEGDDVA